MHIDNAAAKADSVPLSREQPPPPAYNEVSMAQVPLEPGTVTTDQPATFDIDEKISQLRIDETTGKPIPCPSLKNTSDLREWGIFFEHFFEVHGIPGDRWPATAFGFLEEANPQLSSAVKQRLTQRIKGFMAARMSYEWDWQDFLGDLKEVLENVPKLEHHSPKVEPSSKVEPLSEEDTGSKEDTHSFNAQPSDPDGGGFEEGLAIATKVAGTGLLITGATVLAPVVAIAGLNVLGFTAAGVAGGSIAAGLQSIFYGGATTGLFSICQSMAATAVAPTVGAILSGAGTVAAGATLLGSANMSEPDGDAANADHSGAADRPDDT